MPRPEKKGSRHEWRERTDEGEVYQVRATHFGKEWFFSHRLKGEHDFENLERPPVHYVETLRNRIDGKYRRGRVPWEMVEKIDLILADFDEFYPPTSEVAEGEEE